MPRTKKTTISKDRIEKKPKTINRLLGLKDYLGPDQQYFTHVFNKAYELANIYGFELAQIPVLESFDLYKNTLRRYSGNNRDFFSIESEKSEKMTLRPEITQGIIRAYIEKNINLDNKIEKYFSFGPIFRREKLQSGSYRESTQFNLEIIANNKPISEALLLLFSVNLFNELGIKTQLQINSLGTVDNRKEYCQKLNAFYKENVKKTKLCNSCRNLIGKNCLGLLDCKEDACIKEREGAPQIADFLDNNSRNHLMSVLEILDELGISYNFNPYLVRGLNYYNDVVFEFWPLNDDNTVGKQALAGGGRYDALIEQLGGENFSATGIALGIDRIVARLKAKQSLTKDKSEDIIFIAQLGDQARLKALQLFEDLRNFGIDVRQFFVADSLKLQLDEANRIGAKTCLILGKKEIVDGTIILRDMESGAQETVVFSKIKQRLSKSKNK